MQSARPKKAHDNPVSREVPNMNSNVSQNMAKALLVKPTFTDGAMHDNVLYRALINVENLENQPTAVLGSARAGETENMCGLVLGQRDRTIAVPRDTKGKSFSN
jgi:hypothetical protein